MTNTATKAAPNSKWPFIIRRKLGQALVPACRCLKFRDSVMSRAKETEKNGRGKRAIRVIPRQQTPFTPLVEHCFDSSNVARSEREFKKILHTHFARPL